jgi:hypothetical protein
LIDIAKSDTIHSLNIKVIFQIPKTHTPASNEGYVDLVTGGNLAARGLKRMYKISGNAQPGSGSNRIADKSSSVSSHDG